MNFVNALGGGWTGTLLWGLLALVPPAIISLYFLKLRRQPVEVPSTYLWSRTIEDLHVNSIWQRLRQSLLLFLQLLIVALAILACTRPGWQGTELREQRIIFLVDNSASMSATDISPTRLEASKQRVVELIDQMRSDQVAMVISFSDAPKIVQPFTNNRSLIRRKVKQIEPTSRRSDLGDALRHAAGLANPGRTSEADSNDIQVADPMPATLYILSDGGFASVTNFWLGNLTPEYVKMGADSPENVGVVAFNAERNPDDPGRTQAFGRLENYGTQDVHLDVALYLDGELIDASNVEVPAQEAAAVNFELQELGEGVLTLEVQREDQLDLDNRAHAVLNPPRRANVLLVTPGNDSLRLAMTTEQTDRVAEVSFGAPDVLQTERHQAEAMAGVYDLIVYDRCAPAEMPQANTLFIGEVPPGEDWSAGPRQQMPAILDTDPGHPITHLVEMGNVRWNYDGFAVDGPEGASVLFDADLGPLLVVARRHGFEDAVLGMEIVGEDENGEVIPKTEWPIRRSFPVFVMNVLRYLGGSRASLAGAHAAPGAPVEIRPLYPVQSIFVEGPSGTRTEVERGSQSAFTFRRTEELGVYEVREGSAREGVSQRFAVNLFDPRESDLRPRPEIELGYEKVEGQSASEPTRKELWKWLLMGSLVVLVFEWYVYNRRVYL